MTPLPGAMALKPGSVAKPFFGVVPAIVDEKGNILEGAAQGRLVITHPWPALARTIHGSHDRYLKTYFSRFPGLYDTEDGARRDADGYYWISGRIDDVLNVSGHRMGTAELESTLAKHQDVAEASVVGFPHEIKGQGIYAYVVPKIGIAVSGLLRLWGRDNIVFQAVYGEGISRYFIDPKNLNLDAGYDSSGLLKAQPAYGGYAAIQHFWNEYWRSTVTYGFLQVNTTESSPADTYKRTQYLDCNLMYSPAEGITIGGGFLWGQRVNKNDVSGDGFRINFLLKSDLVRFQQDVKKVLPL